MTTDPQNRWLAIKKPKPDARLRLFCFAHAGGTSLMYRSWPEALPRTVEVCPIELPGHGARTVEPLFRDLKALASALTPDLVPHLHKPFAFFGHSMGATIAFELSRNLRARGAGQPVCLLVSGRIAPHVPDPDPPIYALPDNEFLRELAKLNGTPQEALDHKELMEFMMPVLRADFSMVDTYEYEDGPPLECPIIAFGGTSDEKVPRPALEAWREQTAGRFSLKMFPGDHFLLHSAEAQVLSEVTEALEEIMR